MLKRVWKDPVWASVIAAGITSVGSYFAGWWPAINEFLGDAWTFLFASSVVQNWVLGTVSLLAVPTIIFLLAFLWKSIHPTENEQFDWRSYTQDSFFGLRWRWSYSSIDQIQRLNTFCPHCDFQVFPEGASSWEAVDRIRFKCDSCHSDLGVFNERYETLESKAERFIQQKIRNKTWVDPVGRDSNNTNCAK